jgi:hypothetical protein
MALNFLVQHKNFDFVFELEQAQIYYRWLGKEELGIDYWDSLTYPTDYIPVGSVEFVSQYLKTNFPERSQYLIPLNVPEILFPYANRRIANKDISLFSDVSSVFVKSLNTIKHPGSGLKEIGEVEEPEEYQISEVIDIDSEWRVFVFHSQALYMSCYSGDSFITPDRHRIEEMIETYKPEAPVAYTLDIGVEKYRGTFIIEIHRFFSCGLYGFQDHKRYPKMLSQGWAEITGIYE